MSVNINGGEFTAGVLKEIELQLRPLFIKIASRFLPIVQSIVRNSIVGSDTYRQLLPGGVLYHQIGNPNIESNLLEIVDIIIQNIEVNVIPVVVRGVQFSGSIQIRILRDDYNDILSASGAKFTYTNKKGEVHTLEWLDWLLTRGQGATIVSNFHFLGKTSKYSRTNFGIMGKGGSWAIPTIYGGSRNDNWLTKAIHNIEDEIEKTIEQEFRTTFG